uniref:sulfate transport n=1 Tax=Cyathodium cavernarum TaxID=351593 RepID=UPI0030FEAE91
MIPLFFIPLSITFFITKGKFKILNVFELTLAFALHYGTFILVLPIFFLLYRTKQQPWDILLLIAFEPIALYTYSFTFPTALLATIINAIFGPILAWVLIRYDFLGRKFLDATIDLPFALPTSVGGLTLMTVFNDKGWINPFCSWLNIKIVFNHLGVLLAMIFVSLPFVVRTIQPVLQNMEKDLEEAAWCLGASPWTTFWYILFPPSTSSLLTGTALGFSRALGEYGSIVLISSNIPLKDLVISVLLSQKLEQYDYQSAIIIASLVSIISFIALFSINQTQLWRKSF